MWQRSSSFPSAVTSLVIRVHCSDRSGDPKRLTTLKPDLRSRTMLTTSLSIPLNHYWLSSNLSNNRFNCQGMMTPSIGGRRETGRSLLPSLFYSVWLPFQSPVFGCISNFDHTLFLFVLLINRHFFPVYSHDENHLVLSKF